MMKSHVSDRTSWQQMLKGQSENVDLESARDQLLDRTMGRVEELRERFGYDFLEILLDVGPLSIQYPVIEYPLKIKSFSLDKSSEITGVLHGIKGQYLIFDSGVINIRKFGGYVVDIAKH